MCWQKLFSRPGRGGAIGARRRRSGWHVVEQLEDRMTPNGSPLTPVITEPTFEGKVVNPADVHMETAPFSDPDVGQTHVSTDWEIWTVGPGAERVWFADRIGGVERVHTHLGDGVFEGSHAGRTDLMADTDYVLRVRFMDSSGDSATEWSSFAERHFHTSTPQPGTDTAWTVNQPGYVVEAVAHNFQLPVNIVFNPNAGSNPDDIRFYVVELYGTIKAVRNDSFVTDYATGLLNFNPTGNFPGSGEMGLAGLAIDPVTGDLFATLVYSSNPSDESADHYPRVVRFHSNDGGKTAASQTTVLDMAGETLGASHQVSNVTIGPDGKLYVHVGDGFDATAPQNLDTYRGKILRMNLDGTAPADNPFFDAADGISARDYIFARGFRNPFGGAWRAADGNLYEVENGPSVDRLARVDAGANYGFDGSDASMQIGALYNWTPAIAPVNIAFIQAATYGGSGFPATSFDHAFVSQSGPTWASGPQPNSKSITEFTFDAAGNVVGEPTTLLEYTGTGKATVVGLAAGPDGLYFSDLYVDQNYTSPIDRGANILRLRYVGIADFTADERIGPAPLTVTFTDTSAVPNPTAWLWDFGDGSTSTEQNPTHTYTTLGNHDVTLTVTGTAGPATVTKHDFLFTGNFSAGLNAVYYDNKDLTGPTLTRVDPTVNFDWGSGSPAPSIGPDTFSVRWTGLVQPQFSETYTFTTVSDDGVRLWVDGQLVIDNWTNHGSTEDSGTIALTAGQKYDIRMEFYDAAVDAVAQLLWSSPSQPRQAVPQNRLFAPANAPTVTAPAAPQDIGGAVGTTTVAGTTLDRDALIQIYRDENGNGLIDVGDSVVSSQQLTGGATSFFIDVPIHFNSANHLLATSTVSGGAESQPSAVPTVTHDNISPDVTISVPSSTITTNQTVTFTVTYSDLHFDSSTLTAADVHLNRTGTADGEILSVTGTGASRTVTVGNISGDGTLGISLVAGTAQDLVGNLAPAAGPSDTFLVDNTAPTITIGAPTLAATRGGSVSYALTFTDDNLLGVTLTAADVLLNRTGTASGQIQVTGSGYFRTVTLSNITGDGTLGISLAAGTGQDRVGHLAPAAGPSDTFLVDNTRPTFTVSAPTRTATTGAPVRFAFAYTDANLQGVTLTAANVILGRTGTANGQIVVTGSGRFRTVAVVNITGAGTLFLRIAPYTAYDFAGNLAAGFGPSQAFTVSGNRTLQVSQRILAPANIGGTGVIAIDIFNTGTQVSLGVVLRDTLPAFTSIHLARSTTGWVYKGNGVAAISTGNLAAGEHRRILLAYNVSKTAPFALPITNLAAVYDALSPRSPLADSTQTLRVTRGSSS